MKTNIFNYLKTSHDVFMIDPIDLNEHVKKLPAGFYDTDIARYPSGDIFSFKKKEISKIVELKTDVFKDAIDICNSFFKNSIRTIFQNLNIPYKESIVFFGKRGIGKTKLALKIIEKYIIEQDAICFDLTGTYASYVTKIIKEIRKIQSNTIIIFIDECETHFSEDESKFLTLLDSSIMDNTLLIGCTNYIGKIPIRIRERKSRINHQLQISSLPYNVYKEFILGKVPKITPAILEKTAYKCEESNLTIDEVVHTLLNIYAHGDNIDIAIKKASSYIEDLSSEDNEII